jgi:SPOR domain
MLSKTPHRKAHRAEKPPVLPRRSDAAAARRGVGPDRRLSGGELLLPADAVVALVTGSALVLAVATGAVMIEDSRSQLQATAAPVAAASPPATPAPEAVEPRFPPDQQQPQAQPPTQERVQAQPPAQPDSTSTTATASEPMQPRSEALAEVQPRAPTAGPKPFPAPVAPSVELLGPSPAERAPKVQQVPADMRFAVYLASFASDEQALAGWQILQRRYQRPLAGLSPLVRRGKSKRGENVFRLFAGPFESLQAAAQRCGVLATATANCKPADLSQQAAEGSQSWD